MLPSHTLDGSFFISAVMIDVHVRILSAAFHDRRDEAFESALLFRRIKRPCGFIINFAIRNPQSEIANSHGAKEIFQTTLERELIAFEIEKHITRGRRGKRTQTLAGFGWN